MKQLEYFVGKICTAFTVPVNRNFKEENPATYPQPVFEYFMGVVEAVLPEGVILRRINGQTKTFISRQHLVALAEEEVLNPEDQEDAVVIEKLKTEMKTKEDAPAIAQATAQGTSPLLDVNRLLNIAKQ